MPVFRYSEFGTGAKLDASGTLRTINARYNWWGTTEPSEIEAKLEDCLDSGSRPCVQYIPFLAGPVPGEDQFLGDQDDRSGSDADPVNTATGNFTREETDLSIATRGLALVLSRHYNSKETRESPLGPGWTHSYYIVLSEDTPGGWVGVRWGDGRTTGSRTGRAATSRRRRVCITTWSSTATAAGRSPARTLDVYDFDAAARLANLADKNGNATALAYEDPNFPSLATGVTDPAGRTLTLTYDPNGLLASVTDFAVPPRTVSYGYTDGRLTQVTDVLGNTIDYTYDPNGYLAAISVGRMPLLPGRRLSHNSAS